MTEQQAIPANALPTAGTSSKVGWVLDLPALAAGVVAMAVLLVVAVLAAMALAALLTPIYLAARSMQRAWRRRRSREVSSSRRPAPSAAVMAPAMTAQALDRQLREIRSLPELPAPRAPREACERAASPRRVGGGGEPGPPADGPGGE